MVLKVSRGHYPVTQQDIIEIGGGGFFTDRVTAWLEIPEDGIAYPKIYKVDSTQGSVHDFKLTGYVMPFETQTSKLNCKVEAPNEISTTDNGNAKLRVAWINMATGNGNFVALEMLWKIVGDNESFALGWNTTGILAETVADGLDTKGVRTFSIPQTIEEGDTIVFQIRRYPTNVIDDYQGDIMIYGAWLEIDRVGEASP